jgi:hypothetical protein
MDGRLKRHGVRLRARTEQESGGRKFSTSRTSRPPGTKAQRFECRHTVTRSEAGQHTTATHEYLHREGAHLVEGRYIGGWEDRDRLVVSINPERTHFIEQLGRDVVAALQRDHGALEHALVLHKAEGTERKHLHLVMQGRNADWITERDVKAAVDEALELRHERAIEWAKEQVARERERPRTLEQAIEREMDGGLER